MSAKLHYTDQRVLYQSLLAGQNEAFIYLYKTLYHRAAGFIYAAGGNKHDIENAVHEAITTLVFNLNYGKYEWREEAQLMTYITGIARNKWNETRRRAVLTVSLDKEGLILPPDDAQQAAADEQAFEQRRLAAEKGLGLLGDRCQRAIRLFYLEKKSMLDIAALLGWANENVAKKEKYRCLQKLRQLMNLSTWAD